MLALENWQFCQKADRLAADPAPGFFDGREDLDGPLVLKKLVHSGGVDLHLRLRHKGALGLVQEGINLICKPQSIFRSQMDLIYLSQIDEFAKCRIEARIGSKRVGIHFKSPSRKHAAKLTRNKSFLWLNGVGHREVFSGSTPAVQNRQ